LLRQGLRRLLGRVRREPNLRRLIARGLELGDGAYIAPDALIDEGRPWLITIGEGAVISPRVLVLAHDASLIHETGYTRIARVVIGKRVMVGAGAIILPGTTIGDGSVIGAGAVVRGEIPAGSLVVGNPAQVAGEVRHVAALHRAAIGTAPTWPYEGWSNASGISDERRRAQRKAIEAAGQGFVAARPAVQRQVLRDPDAPPDP
jgi:maltose O-acetyltransferase